MRRRVCAGNWKMFKTANEARVYLDRFAELLPTISSNVETILCPPFTALPAACEASRGRIPIGAQNMHWENSGPYTGEISAPMLLDLGVQFVILGHSERRQHFGETDEMVRRKTVAALQTGLQPIVAVGEPLDVRERGDAAEYVIRQVRAALEGLPDTAFADLVLAYEPIWAIGTGRNCDPSDANEMMQTIRSCMPQLPEVPLLYGGSVKAENIAAYARTSDIDGALVGGASLDPVGFARLAAAL